MELSLIRRDDGALEKKTVGNALVVHLAQGMTGEAQSLALGVAADPDHDLVVVDLPVDSPIAMWESVAKALPRRRRGVRLVIGGRSRETTALAGQWLAERINRPVLAPDGSVIPSAGGALFVHAGRGGGWVRFRPGRPPAWEAKRFPRPAWDSGIAAELTPTSSRGVAEPLPGGLWVRPVGFDAPQRHHRTALISRMPAQHDTMTIVLGCPGCPPLALDDAARLWVQLPEKVRAKARFVQYGPMQVPGEAAIGQALADLLGKPVAFYAGVPVGSPQLPTLRTVLYDGRLGWRPFTTELGYEPRSGDETPLPELLSHRPPIHGLDQVSPAVYWYSPDAVVEVVQSGLLVRPPQDGPSSAAIREIGLDAAVHNLTFDAADEGSASRMRLLAEDLLARLDEQTRRMSRVLPAAALLAERARPRVAARALDAIESGHPAPVAVAAPPAAYLPAAPAALGIAAPTEVPGAIAAPAPVPAPVKPEAPAEPPVKVSAAPPAAKPITQLAPADVAPAKPVEPPVAKVPAPEKLPAAPASDKPKPAPAELRFQETPGAESTALLPKRGADKERQWLRKSLGAEYGLMSNTVARILSEHPGFQGVLSTSSSAEVLTDAVAVQLYLSPKGSTIDAGLRRGANGPHVPVARCVVAGLSRLPSHRGPATFATELPPSAWPLLDGRKVLTEWGFLNALTHPSSAVDGETDVLVWSITGRRTKLLEPSEGGVENRVLFVPGTSFKVLETRKPAAGARGAVLLRELTASEIDETGRVANDRASLDELAMNSLRQTVQTWAEAGEDLVATVMDEQAAERFGALPGLA
ncbi:hypothetical protein L3Q65_20795 [Amycolatopsis sp. FU40]|uniref:hypothetical protein n=1 Tax=Amycolatopsis sp. FU40 TaxID=2914159 RepID=UPI001F3EA1F1|nr:hypothetical protein [Amycolatopsis sp. FU40]UKD59057.1 hypothetical protein L3Q65_20795 [Amycolatopsis sp. FU40]